MTHENEPEHHPEHRFSDFSEDELIDTVRTMRAISELHDKLSNKPRKKDISKGDGNNPPNQDF